MNITHKLLEAIRSKNWHEANVLFERSMQQRMMARVDDIKKRVMMEDEKRCELCGGTKNVKMVDDTPRCATCDPESDLDEATVCSECGNAACTCKGRTDIEEEDNAGARDAGGNDKQESHKEFLKRTQK